MKVTFVPAHQPEISVQVQAETQTNAVNSLMDYIDQYQTRSDKLTIHENGRLHILDVSAIISVEVFDTQLTITTTEATYHVRGSLSKMLAQLQSPSFRAISQSAAINLHYLQSLSVTFSGTMTAELKNKTKLPVSRRYVAALRQQITHLFVKTHPLNK
ncbi:MAG TPA: hypothetical protein DCW31_06880 [Lactobacillus sp.]|nr:hypothetical protein [Lactobacillus sp.]